MSKAAVRTSHSVAAAFFVSAMLVAPDIAAAAGAAIPSTSSETNQQTSPSNPKRSHAKKKATNDRSSSIGDFIAGYEAAYALIYDKGDYDAGIVALRALDRDDNPDVANARRLCHP
jgi:hypothetical protein